MKVAIVNYITARQKNQQAKTTKFMFDSLISFHICHLEKSL